MITKIQQMLDNGIPVIVSQSNEEDGSYAVGLMNEEQKIMFNKIVAGTLNEPTPPTIEERLEAAEIIISMLAEGI